MYTGRDQPNVQNQDIKNIRFYSSPRLPNFGLVCLLRVTERGFTTKFMYKMFS